MKKLILSLMIIFGAIDMHAEPPFKLTFDVHLNQNRAQNLNDVKASPGLLSNITPIRGDSLIGATETPFIFELAYIAAQQAAFIGLSYLSSRDGGYGPAAAAGFDVFMGTAAALNIIHQDNYLKKFGYLAVSSGFFAKSHYTLESSKSHSEMNKFMTSYLCYNALVYLGYLLDAL